jgi:hypothetical protein
MPTLLLKVINDKMQILKHANQWKENEIPAILQNQKQESNNIVCQSVAHVGKLTQYNRNLHQGIHNGTLLASDKHPING